jgi:hypothetical protein
MALPHPQVDPQLEFEIAQDLQMQIVEVQNKFNGRRIDSDLLNDVRAAVVKAISRFAKERAPAGTDLSIIVPEIVSKVRQRELVPGDVEVVLDAYFFDRLVRAIAWHN